ncbi:hypothetical protein [Sphingobium fuliginis]|nr:hypothetical protein [Sphingobium fuliginis]
MEQSLFSDFRQREVLVSSSSMAQSGLTLDNILSGHRGTLKTAATHAQNKELSLEARVFEALAAAKIWTSRVAMHLNDDARRRYFKQLDRLHDTDEWAGEEFPVALDSYKGFIRFMLLTKSDSKPGLALSAKGNLVAVWQSGEDRLTIEFHPEGSADWLVSRKLEGLWERAAGNSTIARIPEVIAPYNPKVWLEQKL